MPKQRWAVIDVPIETYNLTEPNLDRGRFQSRLPCPNCGEGAYRSERVMKIGSFGSEEMGRIRVQLCPDCCAAGEGQSDEEGAPK